MKKERKSKTKQKKRNGRKRTCRRPMGLKTGDTNYIILWGGRGAGGGGGSNCEGKKKKENER